ncbi:TIGR01777 family oxidoreductase [Bacillus sp. MRMR6]|uniref:TIGR01777 family oxidoreductase n=1 Tax=Bacillus sp. MRMR6 TaxID=1928617 RepID=UPI000951403A|nr:TIGR01777 family oxidoreductase [Bacillus sp. MRMR6]OLS38530.1 TIGR01777 family protein [Bacillus sp. MRMR6]
MGKKIVLAGGSGFLGKALADFLVTRGYEMIILTRGKPFNDGEIKYIQWDGFSLDDWAAELNGSYALVNFTGKSVNCIYTKANKEEIIKSRIDSVRVLKEAILNCSEPPQAFVQAGSLAIFGDTHEICDEDSQHGSGFSVKVCELWEQEFFKVVLPATRQVLLRIGFALGRDGGALEPLAKLARYNLGGTVGSGKQFISWLHIDDLNEMFLQSIENENYTGIYNATGPNPVSNKEFMLTLRKVLHKPWSPPAPAPLVWLGAYLLMRTEPSLALTGRRCIPKKLSEQNFRFQYTDLETSLSELLQKK